MSDTSDSDTLSLKGSKRLLKKQKTTSSSIVENIKNTDGYSAEIPISDTTFIGEVSPRNPNEISSVDPNPNLIREMTVLEAEAQSESD